MAIVRPFKGFRPLPKYAAQVAARPYDVLSSEEARREALSNPLSFLHVSKPEIDLALDVHPYDERVYQKGKDNLQKLIADGVISEDTSPCFYLYALTFGNHRQVGIVACASVEEYLQSKIKKHELTRKDKEDDRAKHVKITAAHSGPVFLAYREQAFLDSLVASVCLTPPENDFVTDDGVRHQVWIVNDEEAIVQIANAFGDVESLYIADGHHRAAAAARVASELKDSNPNHTGSESYNYFLAVLFPQNQLRIMDYNRVLCDLNDLTEQEFTQEVLKVFTFEKAPGDTKPSKKGELKMMLAGNWYDLVIRPELVAHLDLIERLDVSLLQNCFLKPILGIDDPRTSKRIDFIGGIRGLNEIERRVKSSEMAVGFALYPTSMDELLAVADAGMIMPPKSTWFEPKLRDGLVIHFFTTS